MDDSLKEYRARLVELEEKSQVAFDKTLVTLAAGALGLSFAFVREFLGQGPVSKLCYLIASWICWILSLAFILLSQYFSTLAIRKTIEQVDEGKIGEQRPGGWLDSAVVFLNASAALSFVLGLVLITFFVFNNLR